MWIELMFDNFPSVRKTIRVHVNVDNASVSIFNWYIAQFCFQYGISLALKYFWDWNWTLSSV